MYTKELPKLDFGLYGPFRGAIEKLPKNEPLIRIKQKFDLLIEKIDPKIATYYSPNEGRPSYHIKKILGMLFIQRTYRINSDRVIHRLCLTDALFRWFIGCDSFNEPIPDDTTLVKFRKRLGEHGFKEIFDELVKMAKKEGVIGNFRIIDATHMLSVGRRLGVINFIRKGITKIIKEIATKNNEIAHKLKEKYKRVKVKTCSEAKKLGKNFIKEVVKLKELPDKAKEIIDIMRLGINGEPMVNYQDPDARIGHKSKEFSFGGYKAEILCTGDGLITSFRAVPGNVNEGADISPLIEEDKRKGIKPKEVVGDAYYWGAKNLHYLLRENIKGHFPKKLGSSEIDKFVCVGDKFKCPMGKLSLGKIFQENGELHYWSVNDCKGCSIKERCVSPHETRKKVYLSEVKSAKLDERMDKLKKRWVVERSFAHAVLRGTRVSWYKGLSKSTIHLALVFSLVNLEVLTRITG